MTCVTGIMMDGVVAMAADSAAVEAGSVMRRKAPKIFTKGEFMIGFTTSFRIGDVLEHVLTIPRAGEPGVVFDRAYMVLEFVPAVKLALMDAGFNRRTDGVDTAGLFLVGVHGQLYEIDVDYQVGQNLSGYHAIGSGRDFALGAMHALCGDNAYPQVRGLEPAQIVTAGVEAAMEHCTSVSGPMDLLQLPAPE